MKSTFMTFAGLMSCIAMLFAACSDTENLESQMKEQNASTRADVPEMLTIHYNGNTYENVPTTYDENGDFVFHDKVFAPIYNRELANDSSLSINVKSETEIVLYKDLRTNLESNGYNYDEYIKNIDCQQYAPNISTRTGDDILATVVLFDDVNFRDTSRTFNLTKDETYLQERRMHYIDFNDKCSSIQVTNNLPYEPGQTIMLEGYEYECYKVDAVFIGYEDKDYKNGSITLIATPGTVRKERSLFNFSDKMSSFKFLFAQKGQYAE